VAYGAEVHQTRVWNLWDRRPCRSALVGTALASIDALYSTSPTHPTRLLVDTPTPPAHRSIHPLPSCSNNDYSPAALPLLASLFFHDTVRWSFTLRSPVSAIIVPTQSHCKENPQQPQLCLSVQYSRRTFGAPRSRPW